MNFIAEDFFSVPRETCENLLLHFRKQQEGMVEGRKGMKLKLHFKDFFHFNFKDEKCMKKGSRKLLHLFK